MWAEASRRLLDLAGERLAEMDAASVDFSVLSLNSAAIQAEADPGKAVSAAAAVNDFLATVVAEHPDRFGGFAALPLQDPGTAAKELDRAVNQLGFHGALVNAHTLAALAPGLQRAIIDSAGHAYAMDNPRQTAALRSFFVG